MSNDTPQRRRQAQPMLHCKNHGERMSDVGAREVAVNNAKELAGFRASLEKLLAPDRAPVPAPKAARGRKTDVLDGMHKALLAKEEDVRLAVRVGLQLLERQE